MTEPGLPSAKLHIEVDVSGEHVPEDVRAVLARAETLASADMETKVGPHLGESLATGMETELKKHGKEFTKTLERAVEKETVHVRSSIDVDRDTIARGAEKAAVGIADELEKAVGPGGPINTIFGKITEAVSDAVGAGFNISGKSPLVFALIFAVGALAAVIGSAIEAITALGAAALALPAALSGILVIIGVMVGAFHGLSTAITGAFNAKTVKEFNDAIKDLTPSAQAFVRTLVPALKTIGKEIQDTVQQGFFVGLGSKEIPLLLKNFEQFLPPLKKAAIDIGGAVNVILQAFRSPLFDQFVKDLLPSLSQWIVQLGPAVFNLIQGFSALARTVLPFLQVLGEKFATMLYDFGSFLIQLAGDKDFQTWLNNTLPLIEQVGQLLGAAFYFILTILQEIDQNGGRQLLEFTVQTLYVLAAFLRSPPGQMAIAGMIDLVEILTVGFVGLVILIGGVLDAFEGMVEGIYAAFHYLNKYVFQPIGDFFGNTVPDVISNAWQHVVDFFSDLGPNIVKWIEGVGQAMFNAGANLIGSFVDGLASMLPDVGHVVNVIIDKLTSFLPGSPAKEGPLSGQGYSFIRGQHLVQDLAAGMERETPTLTQAASSMANSVIFGPGSVRVDFNGAVPTDDEARMTGSAVGAGVVDQLDARNTTLAVRTL